MNINAGNISFILSKAKKVNVPTKPRTRYEPSQQIKALKSKHYPSKKVFYDKPNDKGACTRRRTRPWDNCWFSNKPEIIILTVEQAIKQHPNYMRWIYKNLTHINWSVYSIQMLELL